ncbi:MAG TPA: N-6 DNA methylase, partial [Fimbriimonas sp.]|nr:N-6 DNA methylase [Fimbriimonas sp.]
RVSLNELTVKNCTSLYKPKGGIKPHKRFSIQAKRSEVLFVDYMAEHLTPSGRAGIIVPEGIIFQSQTAYTQLRKMLVDSSLVAVISLPAGCFNPYSGVKTSILILDKSLAKKAQSIAFFKVENDGFGLGAQRRPIDKNDLPQVRAELAAYLHALRNGQPVDELQLNYGLIVAKEKIAANDDYNLSGERYREGAALTGRYPWHKLESLIETVTPPRKIQKTAFATSGRFPIIDQSQESIAGWTDDETALIRPSKPLVIFGDHTCAVKLIESPFAQGADGIKILQTVEALDPRFLFQVMRARPLESAGYQRHFSLLKEMEIPLPPLEVQKEIVAEIEGYQKVIDGARAVLNHYRPYIPIHPEWPMVELASVARFQEGPGILAKDFHKEGVPLVRLAGLGGSTVKLNGCNYLDPEVVAQKWAHFRLQIGDILVSTSASFGRPAVVDSEAEGAVFYTGLIRFQPLDANLDSKYLETFLGSPAFLGQAEALATGSSIKHFGPMHLKQMRIHLPPLAIQQQIVAEIEAEQALVNANRELIARFEQKIQATLSRVWGEDESAPPEA